MPHTFCSDKKSIIKYNIVQIHMHVLIHTYIYFCSNSSKVLCFRDSPCFQTCEGMEFSQCACVVLIYFRLVFKPCEALLKHMSCHGVGDIRFSFLWFMSSSWSGTCRLKEHSHRLSCLTSAESQDHLNHCSARY